MVEDYFAPSHPCFAIEAAFFYFTGEASLRIMGIKSVSMFRLIFRQWLFEELAVLRHFYGPQTCFSLGDNNTGV